MGDRPGSQTRHPPLSSLIQSRLGTRHGTRGRSPHGHARSSSTLSTRHTTRGARPGAAARVRPGFRRRAEQRSMTTSLYFVSYITRATERPTRSGWAAPLDRDRTRRTRRCPVVCIEFTPTLCTHDADVMRARARHRFARSDQYLAALLVPRGRSERGALLGRSDSRSRAKGG